MIKKYAISLALLGSLGLSYPVLADVVSESELVKLTKDHRAKHHVLRGFTDKLKKAKSESEFHSALMDLAESKAGMPGYDCLATQDGVVIASSDEGGKSG